MNISRRSFFRGVSTVAVVAVTTSPAKIVTDLLTSALESVPDWCPPGFLPCDGRTLSRLMHQRLFATLGTAYGDVGPTTFRLPDLRSRIDGAPVSGQDQCEVVIAIAEAADRFPAGMVLHVLRGA